MPKRRKKSQLPQQIEVLRTFSTGPAAVSANDAPSQSPQSPGRNFPIPSELKDHLEVMFQELKFTELPAFDLTSPEEAKKASLHYGQLQEFINQKRSQIVALKSALETTQPPEQIIPDESVRTSDKDFDS